MEFPIYIVCIMSLPMHESYVAAAWAVGTTVANTTLSTENILRSVFLSYVWQYNENVIM